MRKIFFVLAFFLLINFSSAVPQINLYGDKIQPYETISGNITSLNKTITSADLKFFEGRREVSFEKDLTGFAGNYYFYVIFNREGNFTIKLDNLLYYDQNGNVQSTNLEKNVSVKIDNSSNKSQVLSVKPGFISSFSDAELTLTNRGEQDLNISYGKNKTSVSVGKTEKIKIIPTEKFSVLELKSYKSFFVPIIFYNFTNNIPQTNVTEKVLSLRTQKSIEITTYENEDFSLNLELFNFGLNNLTDVFAKTELNFVDLNVEKTIIGKSIVNLSLKGKKDAAGTYFSNLTISYLENGSKENLILPTIIFVFKANVTEQEKEKSFGCFDLGGFVCQPTEICVGNISKRMEGCCIGLCSEKTKTKSNGGEVTVGLLILAFLGIVGFAIYKKFKNVRPKQKIIS